MKILNLMIVLLLLSSFSYAQNVNIPDAKFKAYLVGNTAINTNGDNEIQVSEAVAFTGEIDCSSKSITDLTGIEAFVNITRLGCHFNNLTSLDVSKNTLLISIACNDNKLTSLDISKNTALVKLWCYRNQFTALNLKNGNNTAITTMQATTNPNLTCIQVDNASASHTGWTKPATASYNTNCAPPVVNIPNANFKTYLVGNTAINTNGDNEIQVSEAVAFTGEIDCSSKSITDLTGIEAFVNITQLRCNNNNLTVLDVSKNTALTEFACNNNNLTVLDVSKNTALTEFACNNNNLTVLDVSKNTALTEFACNNNNLTVLDVSKNTALTSLDANLNKFTGLDVSKNTLLTFISLGNNKLTSFDASQNTNLTELYLTNNQLVSLNVKNGQNSKLTNLRTTGNPNLACIQVDDVAVAEGKGSDWQKDATASYNTSCVPPVVNIPDANFKNYLLSVSAINTNRDNEIQVSEAVAFTGMISCYSKKIADLTGIEAFVNITGITANTNNITSLDLSKNTALTRLDIYLNKLTSLDLSKNTLLTFIDLGDNNLTSFDASQNTNLTELYLTNNQLTSLNVKNGQNTKLTKLKTINNPNLSCIQVDDVALANQKPTSYWQKPATASYNTNCASPVVNIPNANFKAYLVGNTAINTNGDNEIQVSEAVAFTGEIDCSSKSITDLTGIEAFVNITQLRCNNNNLTVLDVSKNTALTEFACNNNNLTVLDVSKNTALTEFACNNNNLTVLDVSKNTALTEFACNNNNLTALNLKNGNNTALITLQTQNNPNLTCIQVDDVAVAEGKGSDWQKDATASYNTSCVPPVVNIPDANFKAYLVSNTAINTNRDNEIQVSEAEAFTGEIYCYNKGITDLTGIEAFINIGGLSVSGNNLTSLDVSKNIGLGYLYASANNLISLDVSKNIDLEDLEVSNNNLTSLDMSKNIGLGYLDGSGNKLTSLDVSKNIGLYYLDASANNLISLNLKNGNNNNLKEMYAGNNPNLACIQVDDVAVANGKGGDWQKDAIASYNTNCNYVLPVVLVSYTAKVAANYALLQWQTATELNNKGFEIYRSANDGNFVKISEVVKGKNSNGNTYSFTDKAPLSGNNYYKLVQIDNDGKANELGIREVTFNLVSSVAKIHPNPTGNMVSVLFPTAIFTDLQITDLNGRVLQGLTIKATENSKQVSLGAYPAGIYIIKLSGKAKAESHKIIKK